MTGEGQYIDVSIQASVAKGIVNAPLFWEINKVILKRQGADRVGLSKGGGSRTHWPCKDGHVAFSIFGGTAGARTTEPWPSTWRAKECAQVHEGDGLDTI